MATQVGNYNLRDVFGMVNLPVTEGVALRVAGKKRRRDGFTHDVSSGRDYDDQNFDTFRVSLRLNPTDTLESITIFDWVRTREHGTALVATAVDPNAPAIAAYGMLRSFGFPVSNVVGQFAQQQARPRYRFDTSAGEDGTLDAYGVKPFEHLKNYGITTAPP